MGNFRNLLFIWWCAFVGFLDIIVARLGTLSGVFFCWICCFFVNTNLLDFSSKQCNSFKTRAIQVKEGLEKRVAGINVLVNPDKVIFFQL